MKIAIEIPNAQIVNIIDSSTTLDWGVFPVGMDSDGVVSGKRCSTLHESGDEDKHFATHRVTREVLEKGIAVIASKYPHLLRQMLDENHTDAYSFDYLVQCGIFGELKYS